MSPFFEIVSAELSEIMPSQSQEIAAIGYDGERIIVQFHRHAGLFAGRCSYEEYNALLGADSIVTVLSAQIAEAGTQAWQQVFPLARRKRKH